ncbi:MAG: hypothetical protein P8164_01150 [Gammaproteobacteria bacterium]|jgi:hypothetical protein
MKPTFYRLNDGWNAEPYSPQPRVSMQGHDLLLQFLVNAMQFTEFMEGERGMLRFAGCRRYRLGPPSDDDWYDGRCRFSKLAPEWGEFFVVQGDAMLLDAPQDWQSVAPKQGDGRHFLFYLRDNTFECVADDCIVEQDDDNALHRTAKKVQIPTLDQIKPPPYRRRRLCRSQ